MRLVVKNFGPLKDIDIELNKINVFIGENGSGKSVLAKLIATLTDTMDLTQEGIARNLKHFQIDYLSNHSYIKIFYMSDEKYFLEIDNNRIAGNVPETMSEISNLKKAIDDLGEVLLGESHVPIEPSYIPAERNIVSLLSRSLGSLLAAEIPLPKFLISFISDFEKARNEISELDLLNVRYVNTGKDKIYFNEDEFIELEQSSSGIQSALPLYLTVRYFMEKKRATVLIEEPEQNLFPKAQKETVEYIIEHIDDQSSVFMMTHSPYILTALNNLILANDVKEQKGDEAIKGLVEQKHCVKFEEVSAYTIANGRSMNILDQEDRLIGVNVIDAISDEVSETFNALLSKLD